MKNSIITDKSDLIFYNNLGYMWRNWHIDMRSMNQLYHIIYINLSDRPIFPRLLNPVRKFMQLIHDGQFRPFIPQ